MHQITQVSTQIGKLEIKQKSLTEQLKEDERFKNKLIQSRDELLNGNKNLIISIIQSYYEITSAEG